MNRLTGDDEGGVAGAGDAGHVAGDAPVDAGVVFLATVHHFQEEEVAARKQDAVRLVVGRHRRRAGDDQLSIAVPSITKRKR